jgi:hypothetical protein
MGTIYIDEVVASMPQIEGTRWRAARSFASTPAGPMRLRLLQQQRATTPAGSTWLHLRSGELRERSAIHPDRPPRSSISCWQCSAIGYEANPAASHDAQSLPATSPPQMHTPSGGTKIFHVCGSGMRGCTEEREAIHQSLEKEMDKLTESRLPTASYYSSIYCSLFFK